MWKKLLLLAVLGLIAAVLPGNPAAAQASRTWVSRRQRRRQSLQPHRALQDIAGAISKHIVAARSTRSIPADLAR